MLKTLRRIVEEVYAAKSSNNALDILVERIRAAMDTEACSVFLLDHRRGQYVLMATDGLNKDVVGKLRIGLNQGLTGLIGAREEPLNLDNAPEHPNFYAAPGLNEETLKAFLGVPIIYRRRLLGVLAVHQGKERHFNEEEEAFLVTLSTQLAPILTRVDVSAMSPASSRRTDEATYQGVGSSTGVAIGTAVVVYPQADLSAVPDREVEDIDVELAEFETAIEAVRNDVRMMRERFATSLPPAEQILFDAYLGILDSNSLGGEISEKIREGHWAQGALRDVIQQRVRQFEDMEDEYLSERATDIKELGQRILARLQSGQNNKTDYPPETILIGEDLTAAELADVPQERLAAVVSLQGSANAHVAILAKALGIPAVMGAGEISLGEIDTKPVIVDGYYGQIYVDPPESLRKEFVYLAKEERELDASLEQLQNQPAETMDGFRMQMWVNAGLDSDASKPFKAGAEGVGLYRTEVPFMMRERFPTEQEQVTLYRQLLKAFAPHPVTMRTLDIGGDKPLSYFPVEEDNPFLGWRGIRITLDQPEIFITQLRAMLRANLGLNNLRIMFPMISNVGEFDDALTLVQQVYSELKEEYPELVMPKIGVMIEVPSAVYQARELARRADFFSIGSNDLAQYLLAVDRTNSKVANLYDTLHPAVLMAIRQAVKACHRAGKPVSVCGEMAGDPLAAVLLLAMEVDSLSSSAANLPRIKWVIRRFSLDQAKQLLRDTAAMESPIEIRAHLELALERAGLGGLIRAGK
tara:strand:+ start:138697 stop:140955 length:2259 start_codon:yes stop_codon:yes gene_type:complete